MPAQAPLCAAGHRAASLSSKGSEMLNICQLVSGISTNSSIERTDEVPPTHFLFSPPNPLFLYSSAIPLFLRVLSLQATHPPSCTYLWFPVPPLLSSLLSLSLTLPPASYSSPSHTFLPLSVYQPNITFVSSSSPPLSCNFCMSVYQVGNALNTNISLNSFKGGEVEGGVDKADEERLIHTAGSQL